MSAGAASRLRTLLKAKPKLTYVRLNSQTPCPPRGAVPVNQGRTWEAISFCSFRIAFGHGCDCPSYVRINLPEGRALGNRRIGLGSGLKEQRRQRGRDLPRARARAPGNPCKLLLLT